MKITHRLSTLVLALLLAACGSEPTSLDDGGSQVAQSVEVVGGQGQTVQVEETTDTVRVVVRDSADDPIPGETVNYEVDGPFDCGNWETGSLPTDQDGRAGNVIHIGTVASTRADVDCTFRVVHARQGAPAPLVDSVEVSIEPGEIASSEIVGEFEGGEVHPQHYKVDGNLVEDAHGNPAAWRLRVESGALSALGTNPLDTLSRTLEADSTLERGAQGDTLDTGTVTALHADTAIAVADYAITQGDQERFLIWRATFEAP